MIRNVSRNGQYLIHKVFFGGALWFGYPDLWFDALPFYEIVRRYLILSGASFFWAFFVEVLFLVMVYAIEITAAPKDMSYYFHYSVIVWILFFHFTLLWAKFFIKSHFFVFILITFNHIPFNLSFFLDGWSICNHLTYGYKKDCLKILTDCNL